MKINDSDFNIDSFHENSEHKSETSIDGNAPNIVFGATQGKKGHKAPRINMAFSPDNHKWIKTRSRQLGISATELVNAIVERERLK